MTSQTPIESRRRIADQAASWLLTLQSDTLSTAQRAEFVDWLRASPLHISEMLWVCQLQRSLGAFKGWHLIAQLHDGQTPNVVALLKEQKAVAQSAPPRHRLRNLLLTGGSIAALCLIGILAFTQFDQTVLRTQLSERREMTLADGSVVDLAPDSELVVRYRSHERLITLNHGEALFHVARNSRSPFIVQAALTRVRAIGTVFNVERGDQGVSVTVVEGRVAVSPPTGPRSGDAPTGPGVAALSLGADEQVSISPTGRPSAVRKVRSEDQVGWARGQLVFESETIAEIAHRFNLYNRTQIQVLDPDLAARRISGMFRASDPGSFVAFVQSIAGAEVAQPDSNHITLGSPARPNP
jgi:transmembrane sensor